MPGLTFFQPNPGPDRPCPFCGAPRPHSERYPDALCPECVHRATDAAGRPLSFGNATMTGGLSVRYADTGEQVETEECLVDGRPCAVREAHFGGIVVYPVRPPAESRAG